MGSKNVGSRIIHYIISNMQLKNFSPTTKSAYDYGFSELVTAALQNLRAHRLTAWAIQDYHSALNENLFTIATRTVLRRHKHEAGLEAMLFCSCSHTQWQYLQFIRMQQYCMYNLKTHEHRTKFPCITVIVCGLKESKWRKWKVAN